MSSRHAIVPRGLNATRSPLSQGRFGRMFRKLAPAKFGPNDSDNVANLSALADKMVAGFDGPKDGPDAEESGIPSLYTYFGQFIDHDITLRSGQLADQAAGSRRARRLPHTVARHGQSLRPRPERPALHV
ncbi:hypothetical protein ACVWZW_006924 [Bradyrhizobium sp. F1.13.4]